MIQTKLFSLKSLILTMAIFNANSLFAQTSKDYTVREVYASMSAEDGATILNPTGCNTVIGNGGNYTEANKTLVGKCSNAGLSPIITGPRANQLHVSFRTDPNYSGPVNGNGNDRTELAHTQDFFPFNLPFQIGFRMMIPSTSSVTGIPEMFYPLQLWQCGDAAPIAGLRIKAGTSHEVNFVTSHNNAVATTRFTKVFTPNVWHQVLLSVTVSPTNPAVSTFKVTVDGTVLGTYTGLYGNSILCQNEQGFRVKYGIYKDSAPGKYYEINFDDLRIANRYDLARPW